MERPPGLDETAPLGAAKIGGAMTSSKNIATPPAVDFDWRGRLRAAWRRVMAGARFPARICLGALLALRA